jgi:hypothetical protein
MPDATCPPKKRGNMKPLLKMLLLAFISLAPGCASAPLTESNNPEITLTDVRFDCVRSVFLNALINQGYTVRSASNNQIVAGKTADDAAFWYYSFHGGAPEKRVTIHFLPSDTPNALRVVMSADYVTNQATASENSYYVQGTQEDQDQLIVMKASIEAHCRKSPS